MNRDDLVGVEAGLQVGTRTYGGDDLDEFLQLKDYVIDES